MDAGRVYFLSMAVFLAGVGLITTFYPSLLDLFQTAEGIAAKSAFSDHVWRHDGLDILALAILLFALSRETASPWILRATAFAALMPTIAIGYSTFATPFWSLMFLGPGAGALAFVVWGFLLARQAGRSPRSVEVDMADTPTRA